MSGPPTPQAFSVDVEEYFQVSAFEEVLTRDEWAAMPSRLGRSVDSLLDMMAAHSATGTFFILGWVADRHPDIPRLIAEAGHEIASHGWWHRRLPTLTPEEFRREVRDSRRILEDLTGKQVLGFRAPSFSLLAGQEWAYDVLIEEEYLYDSSVFPIRRPDYGNPRARPFVHVVERDAGTIVEIPLATRVVAGMRVPGAGGAYLRLLPFALTRGTALECVREGRSGVFYTHPWEIDEEQPRLEVPPLTRLRHYGRLDRTAPRLERLFAEFDFRSIAECYGELLPDRRADPRATWGPAGVTAPGAVRPRS
ncbi:MAG: DUF3473 domain-containing protein [Gemmatimonadota bacterium]|nr:DUF3473 domain-containing protein [Gemmatimonadota bacterium]